MARIEARAARATGADGGVGDARLVAPLTSLVVDSASMDNAFAHAQAQSDAEDLARLVAAAAKHGYAPFAPLGRGGMGSVWIARTSDARGVVALKAMLPKVASDPDFRAMFLDEGRIASRIASPHVARVFALHDAGDVLFHVMEWVDGESLLALHRAHAERRERIPIPAVLHALAQACDGLHAAHELSGEDGRPLLVVHRDVSPANVLVSAHGVAKLVDFGVAKARARIAQSTLGFRLKGRVSYAAPEYALGHAIDRRADMWSMGATLYFLLAGRAPFSASNETAALFKLTSGEPLPKLPSFVPPEVAAIAYRALQRAPEDRYATAAEMRDALTGLARTLDARPPAEQLAELVTAHEPEEARVRRRVAQEHVRRAPHDEPDAPTLPWPHTRRARVVSPDVQRWAAAVIAFFAMAALVLHAFATTDASEPARRAPHEKAERPVDAIDEDLFEILTDSVNRAARPPAEGRSLGRGLGVPPREKGRASRATL